MSAELLALIPARGGSKELPGKALRTLAGRPLIAHSIELALRCPEVARVVVSTDSEQIAATAESLGADVPFLRPAELAGDETPMWPVVRHALATLDPDGALYEAVLLLQPTSPARLPEDVSGALALLHGRPDADGVLGVSTPRLNPIWAAVVERDRRLEPLVAEGNSYARRQDVPRVLQVNGSLYLWRTGFVRAHEQDPWGAATLLGWEIPELRAIDIDTAEDLRLAELLLEAGLVRLPWVP
jgi:CMP-N,N'-diacetyllegionaminic acid synthase